VKTGGGPPVRARRVAASSTEASEKCELNVNEDGARISRSTTRSVDGGSDTEARNSPRAVEDTMGKIPGMGGKCSGSGGG
jgi:hypothetical protein